jgi:hypothetical protein
MTRDELRTDRVFLRRGVFASLLCFLSLRLPLKDSKITFDFLRLVGVSFPFLPGLIGALYCAERLR